jgi:hypothetical protein
MGTLDRKINVHCLVKLSAALISHFISKQCTNKECKCEIVYIAHTEPPYIVLLCMCMCTYACVCECMCVCVCKSNMTNISLHLLKDGSNWKQFKKKYLLNLYLNEGFLKADYNVFNTTYKNWFDLIYYVVLMARSAFWYAFLDAYWNW